MAVTKLCLALIPSVLGECGYNTVACSPPQNFFRVYFPCIVFAPCNRRSYRHGACRPPVVRVLLWFWSSLNSKWSMKICILSEKWNLNRSRSLGDPGASPPRSLESADQNHLLWNVPGRNLNFPSHLEHSTSHRLERKGPWRFRADSPLKSRLAFFFFCLISQGAISEKLVSLHL